jgi:hypothetical protein
MAGKAKPGTQKRNAQIAHEYTTLLANGMAIGDAWQHLGEKFGLSTGTIRNILQVLTTQESITFARPTLHDLKDPEKIAELVTAERETRRWKEEAKNWEKRYESNERELVDLRQQNEAILAIKDSIVPVSVKPPKSNGGGGEAVAVVVASDWHMGAIVRPNTVNFLNEVNPDITAKRIEKFFHAVVKLTKKEQAHVKIKTLVLALIGDFIENHIHIELMEDSTLSPIEQMMAVQNCIVGGIQYILANTELNLVVPTCSGNHGRTTDKTRASTEYKNSFEQLMYWNMAKFFAGNKRVKFQVADGYFNYVDVYDHKLRFHHGHSCKFGGGIGGLMIPLRKFTHRANQQVFADTSICGHFHTLLMDYDVMVNGSLVGPSAYGMRLGFPPERPQQIFRLLDSKRGWTMSAPILVAERESKSGRFVG